MRHVHEFSRMPAPDAEPHPPHMHNYYKEQGQMRLDYVSDTGLVKNGRPHMGIVNFAHEKNLRKARKRENTETKPPPNSRCGTANDGSRTGPYPDKRKGGLLIHYLCPRRLNCRTRGYESSDHERHVSKQWASPASGQQLMPRYRTNVPVGRQQNHVAPAYDSRPAGADRLSEEDPRQRATLPPGNRAVPSPQAGLTTVFGMGTGVAPPL